MPTNNQNKKTVPIKYTSRDFSSIKEELLNYTKRYYPDSFQDFSEASFGSLMLDTVAYAGDVLSYYLDYQVNESFLDTALEYENVVKLSRQMGYRFRGVPISTGIVTFYITVPATTDAIGPDLTYAPILERGTKVSSEDGIVFTLNEDVDFASDQNEYVVANTDSTTGTPTKYAIRAYGQVISGEIAVQTLEVGDFERFPRFNLNGLNIVEVISVFDSQGNQYYEVDSLSQDIIYKQIKNPNSANSNQAPFLMKPMSVPRRFITENNFGSYSIQFGHGSPTNIQSGKIVEPSKVVLNVHGRDYTTDTTFDPTNLVEADKLGVAPANTTLTVLYRINGSENVNVAARGLNRTTDVSFSFPNFASLSTGEVQSVIGSLEVENETPINGDTTMDTVRDLKQRAYGMFSSQSRAVTEQDYVSIAYALPPQFGSVKRISVVQDKNSFKRNLNLYVIGENNAGNLSSLNTSVKENLKTWLSNYKMINDTIDILDGVIINIGVEYSIVADEGENGYRVIEEANQAIFDAMAATKLSIGESLRYSDVFRALKNVDGVLDVIEVNFTTQSGDLYASSAFDIQQNTSADGRILVAPENAVFEIRYPNVDIIGTVK
jgi:uncharacterized phage protein gp47/JayE